MSRLQDLGSAVVVALLVGGAAAWGADAVRTATGPQPAPVGDRVQRAADALRSGDHVYVAADAHDRLPPEAEARLEALAEESSLPVHVVVWEGSSDAGYDLSYDAMYQLQRLVDRDGVYVLLEGPGDGIVEDRVEGGRVSDLPDDLYGDPETRLREIIAAADRAEVEPAWDYWGGPSGAALAGALAALVALPCCLVLLGLGRLLTGRPFRLPGGWG